MKNNFNKFYKRILKDPLDFELYKREQFKNIKSFRDINIDNIIKKLDKQLAKQIVKQNPKNKIHSIKKTFTKLIKQLNLE